MRRGPFSHIARRASNLAKARSYLLPSPRAEADYRQGLAGILEATETEDIDDEEIREAEQETQRLFVTMFYGMTTYNLAAATAALGVWAAHIVTFDLFAELQPVNGALVAAVLEELRAGTISRRAASARLALIGTNESLRVNAEINQRRQRAAGAETYTWLTMRDDRVRPTHRSKEGRTFRWDSPPADTGHPGHDVNCRCIAIGNLSG